MKCDLSSQKTNRKHWVSYLFQRSSFRDRQSLVLLQAVYLRNVWWEAIAPVVSRAVQVPLPDQLLPPSPQEGWGNWCPGPPQTQSSNCTSWCRPITPVSLPLGWGDWLHTEQHTPHEGTLWKTGTGSRWGVPPAGWENLLHNPYIENKSKRIVLPWKIYRRRFSIGNYAYQCFFSFEEISREKVNKNKPIRVFIFDKY